MSVSNRLILYPQGLQTHVTPQALVNCLRKCQLISAPFEFEGHVHYLAGDKFIDHISFLGCSPFIQLEPPELEGSEFCHVTLQFNDDVKFLGGENVRAPSCPACKARDEQVLQTTANNELSATTPWRCPQCGVEHLLHQLNWRQTAAFSRLSVEVWGVHEGEAVPNNGLMNALAAVTDGPWAYFYQITK